MDYICIYLKAIGLTLRHLISPRNQENDLQDRRALFECFP